MTKIIRIYDDLVFGKTVVLFNKIEIYTTKNHVLFKRNKNLFWFKNGKAGKYIHIKNLRIAIYK